MNPLNLKEAKIAWLGAGNMGGPMAGNLAKAGYQVTVWNRTVPRPSLDVAVRNGCAIAASVDEALKDAQVVCSCLTDGPALRSVLFPPGRDLKALLAPDAIAVDFATIGPVEARGIAEELAQRGVRFVDAPVTGGDIGAQNATLTIMVGGDSEDVEGVRPLLNAMGKKVVHAGPIGAGQSLKLVNQLLCGVNLLAAVEAFQVAERTGVDRAQVVEACGGGAAGSWQLVNLGPKIIAQDERPGFRVAHLYKDLKFLRDELAAAGAKQPPYLELAIAAFARITELGQGDLGTQTAWKVHPVSSPCA